MRTTVHTDAKTGDQYTQVFHPSGLEIRVMECKGYQTAYALFGTRYGSINTRFRLSPTDAFTEVPEGIAHFLEHKLFENEDCDVFSKFNALGAYANAFTSFDRTAYLFQASRAFDEALEILLDFVQQPYFTEQTVAKEQGIIAQEIQMYLDEPSDRLFYQMLEGLYHHHPVKIDVAGSVESIAKITPELLYRCYDVFYNLHNMVLCVAGNVTMEQVLAVADRVLKPAKPSMLESAFLPEPVEIVRSFVSRKMAVGKPMFSIGFKSKPEKGMELCRAGLVAQLMLQLLAGRSSALYQRLTAEGLVNEAFAVYPFAGDGYFTLVFEGESDNPQAVLDAILAEIEHCKTHGFDADHFSILKRASYGERVRNSNKPEPAAMNLLGAFIVGIDSPFAESRILAELTLKDVQACLCERLQADKVCLSVVEPE